MRTSGLLVLMIIGAALAGNPLGNCQNGTAVSTVAQSQNGRCKYPIAQVANYAYASVSESFFNAGAECGACFELTGPKGTTTVIVTDACPAASDPKCNVPSSTPHFIVNNASYSMIVDPVNNEQITDLGWRRVTCNVADDSVVMMTTNVGSVSVSKTYFNVIFTNSRLQVTSVKVTGKSGTIDDQLNRQGSDTEGSAVWEWNHVQNDPDLDFPATISISGATDQILTIQVTNAIISTATSQNYKTLAFTQQFRDVVSTGAALCPMAMATPVIYSNGVIGGGWNDQQYFHTIINSMNTTRPYNGATYDYSSEAEPYGGAQFKRIGGFETAYFDNLTFVASSDNNCNLFVYFGSGNSTRGLQITTTTTNQVFNFNLANDFKVNPFEYYLVFQNNQNDYCHTFLSELKFTLNATSPLDNIPLVTTTGYTFNESSTTSPIIFLDTSTTAAAATTGQTSTAAATTGQTSTTGGSQTNTGGQTNTGAQTNSGGQTTVKSTSLAISTNSGALSIFAVAAVTAAALLF